MSRWGELRGRCGGLRSRGLAGTRTVVSHELSAPPALIASATAAMRVCRADSNPKRTTEPSGSVVRLRAVVIRFEEKSGKKSSLPERSAAYPSSDSHSSRTSFRMLVSCNARSARSLAGTWC